MGIHHHIDRAIAVVSCILGIIVLLISMWTFCSIIYQNKDHEESSGRSDSSQPVSSIPPVLMIENRQYTLEEDANRKETNDDKSISFWTTFETMPETFKGMIIGCAWITFIGAVLQIISSLCIVVSTKNNVRQRSRCMVAVHFIAFLILLGTLFTPAAYDRTNDRFASITSFNARFKMSLKEIQEEGLIKFFISDLHAYYTVLLVDSGFLFISMITVSCLMQFDTRDKVDLNDRYRVQQAIL